MKRYIKPAIAVVVVLILAWFLFGQSAFAAPVIVSWTNPTQRTDNSVFPSTQIQHTLVEWGSCAGTAFGVGIGSGQATGAVTNYTTPALPAGDYCFRAFTVDLGGVSSAASNVVAKTVITAPPKPPTISTVTTVAYIIKGNPRQRWFAAVGTVPLGTVCGAVYPRNDLYATIPREAVTITGNYKGQTLYGICG